MVNAETQPGGMRIHVALGDVLIMLQAKGLFERIPVRGEAEVEAVRAVPHADTIAAHLFSDRENAAYRALDPRDRPLGFFHCWTRKEAFVKALGDGLFHPLDRFDVSLAPGEPAAILRVEDTPGDRCGWRLESLSPAPGFVGAVVVSCGRR